MTTGEAVLNDIELHTNQDDETSRVLPSTFDSDRESLIGSNRPLPQQITLWKPSRYIIAFDIFVFLLALGGCLLGGLAYSAARSNNDITGTVVDQPPSTDVEVLRRSLADLESDFQKLVTRVTTLESMTTSAISTLNALSSTLTSLSSRMDATVATVMSQGQTLGSQGQTISSQGTNLATAMHSIDALTGAVHDLQVNGGGGGGGNLPAGFVASVQAELADLTFNVSLVQSAARNTFASLSDVSMQLLHLHDLATDTQTQLGSTRQQVSAYHDDVSTFMTEIDGELATLNQTMVETVAGMVDTLSIDKSSLANLQIKLNRYASTILIGIPNFFTQGYLAENNGRVFMWTGPGPDIKDVPHCNAGSSPGYRFASQQLSAGMFMGLYTLTIHTATTGPNNGPFVDLYVTWAGNSVYLVNTQTVPQRVAQGPGSIAFTLRYSEPDWFVPNMQGIVDTTLFDCYQM